MKKDLLYLLTFISILIIVFSTGYFSTNYLVDISSQQFLKNQLASSKREAKEMANFIADRVEQGIPKQQIIYTIQNMIEGTDMEAGFICMFDWSGKEICHPDPREIGKLVVQN
ncbi:MAG: LytTR family transcriptional regulator, partial [Flavobacteriaceae bacterium]|nr:LytTR family transcriptional regulator [Flavobacteriaceae bacterium]